MNYNNVEMAINRLTAYAETEEMKAKRLHDSDPLCVDSKNRARNYREIIWLIRLDIPKGN